MVSITNTITISITIYKKKEVKIMEKLILERDREDFYILEVNDKGETIEFDLTDIALPEKILNASNTIGRLDKEYREKVVELLNEESEEIKVKKAMEIEKEKCVEMRKAFDEFLGDGACQKIFGDKNYYGMFIQLFNALEPHFAKMKIKTEKAKKKLVSKYLPKDSDVI